MHRLVMPCIALWFVTHPAMVLAAPAPAPSLQSVEGTVLSSQAAWNSRGDRIFTDSVIRTPDGASITVRQPGGAVDDISMVQFPASPLLRPGDEVTLQARIWPQDAPDAPWQVSEITALTHPGPDALFHRMPGEEAPPLGYVRTTTNMGRPLYWASDCVFLTYDSEGTSHLAGDEEFAIMDQVFDTWKQAIQGSSYLQFELEARAPREVGNDGINVIKFREKTWCRPATETDPEECYEAQAAALTTLFFFNEKNPEREGEIIDGDIELNAVDFAISAGGTSLGGRGCLADLANTLTHEVGHLIGLDHTCRLSAEEPPRLDNEGNEVPFCNGTLPASIIEATMHPSQACGETKKATLEADDIAAAAAIYPTDLSSGSCARVALGERRGCCSVGPATGMGPASDLLSGLLLLAGAGVLTRLRRRRATR